MRPSEWPLWIKIAASLALIGVGWAGRGVAHYIVTEWGTAAGLVVIAVMITGALLYDRSRRRRGLPPL